MLGLLTIVATIATAIPAFIQLNRDRPLVYYTAQSISAINHQSPDAERVLEALRANHLPTARTVVAIENKGQGPAAEVRVAIRAQGPVQAFTTSPSAADRPVWVSVPATPQELKHDSTVRIDVNGLAPGRVFTASIAYDAGIRDSLVPEVDVFYDGKSGIRVADLAAAPVLSLTNSFRTPILVFVGGIALILLVAFAIVLRGNADLARALERAFIDALRRLTWPF